MMSVTLKAGSPGLSQGRRMRRMTEYSCEESGDYLRCCMAGRRVMDYPVSEIERLFAHGDGFQGSKGR